MKTKPQPGRGQSAQILQLRAEGKSYSKIAQTVGCAHSLVGYYCGQGQRDKKLRRDRNMRQCNVVAFKTRRFLDAVTKNAIAKMPVTGSDERLLYGKIRTFGNASRVAAFTAEDVLAKFGTATVCYLTGRPINMEEPRTYQFDHIVPKSRGGTNTFDNLGIACKEANAGKSDMILDEFLQLCQDVLTHHGYTVTK